MKDKQTFAMEFIINCKLVHANLAILFDNPNKPTLEAMTKLETLSDFTWNFTPDEVVMIMNTVFDKLGV